MDWGSIAYVGEDGRKGRLWAFVMVLRWSRTIYVEFVQQADVAAFMRAGPTGLDQGQGGERGQVREANLWPSSIQASYRNQNPGPGLRCLR